MFKCLCGRYSNFGTTCSYCSKDISTIENDTDPEDVFYLVDKADREELARRLMGSTNWN